MALQYRRWLEYGYNITGGEPVVLISLCKTRMQDCVIVVLSAETNYIIYLNGEEVEIGTSTVMSCWSHSISSSFMLYMLICSDPSKVLLLSLLLTISMIGSTLPTIWVDLFPCSSVDTTSEFKAIWMDKGRGRCPALSSSRNSSTSAGGSRQFEFELAVKVCRWTSRKGKDWRRLKTCQRGGKWRRWCAYQLVVPRKSEWIVSSIRICDYSI